MTTTTTPNDDGLDIPDALKVANRTPLTPEQEQRLAEVNAAASVSNKPVDWDKPKGMSEDEWAKVKADRIAEKKAKTEARIAKLKASKELAPNPKGQPQPKRKDQLPLPPRKGSTLPTPRAPRPSKPATATTTALKAGNAPTGDSGPNPAKPKETDMTAKKTTNAKKTSAAAAKLVKSKIRPQKAAGASKAGNGGIREGTKLAAVVALLKRPQGCTAADVLAETGWPTVSMPQQAKAAGLILKKSKEKGQPTVYRV